MNGRRGLIFVVIFAVGIAIGLMVKENFFPEPVAKVEPDDTGETKSREQALDEAAIIAEDIELVQGKQGAMDWKLLARTAKYNQERKLIGVERPQLTAYFGNDRKEVYVRADRGEVDQGNDNLTLYDNVTGRFGTLEVIAQHLDYVGAMSKVYLKGGVTVRRPDMTLEAKAVEIDLVTRELTAAGGVEALLAPKGLENNPLN